MIHFRQRAFRMTIDLDGCQRDKEMIAGMVRRLDDGVALGQVVTLHWRQMK
jgi:hypothetical protein